MKRSEVVIELRSSLVLVGGKRLAFIGPKPLVCRGVALNSF
jgi:hypothetical protein